MGTSTQMKPQTQRTISDLLATIPVIMYQITPEERVELFAQIRASDYCNDCGYRHPTEGRCQCENDT